MKVYLSADHRGYQVKEKIKVWLKEWNFQFEDLGNILFDPEDDYTDFAKRVAERLNREDRGIVICGSGIGASIVANRKAGVRCGLGFSREQVRAGRNDDDINCLALPADYLSEEQVKAMIETFLGTEFSGEERRKRRIGKLS